MAEVQAPWKRAQTISKELQALLKSSDPLYEDVERLMDELRIACQDTIFADFELAHKNEVGLTLWTAHGLVNTRYRKLLAHFKGEQKKHVVERRKIEKRYVDFIKKSQYFYKGYIQHLASHFAGLEELRGIAQSLSLDDLAVDERLRVSPEVEHLIKMSCYSTLLHLGDLSRYRNIIRTKDRSWDTAIAYYTLANDLHPNSGNAHNQMAVIAFLDNNHLNGIYHLYRAIAVKGPALLARGNLETECKKIATAWDKDKQKSRPHKGDNESMLILWFVRLHAKFYHGAAFSTQIELENEVLTRLALLVKQPGSEQTLRKLVLISIAAGYLAAQRVKEDGEAATAEVKRSYYFFLGFNLRVFTKLLHILTPELVKEEELPGAYKSSPAPENENEMLTTVARRILPSVRQYFAWAVGQRNALRSIEKRVSAECKGNVGQLITTTWETMTDALTSIADHFPYEALETVSYMLEEDETTVGFLPLLDLRLKDLRERESGDPVTFSLYYEDAGQLKLRVTDADVQRQPATHEMLARVADVLKCGVILHHELNCPISLSTTNNSFIYSDEPMIIPKRDSHVRAPVNKQKPAQKFTPSPVVEAVRNPETKPAEARHAAESIFNMDSAMHQMVDNLLEPSRGRYSTASNETSYGMHSATANDIFGPLGQKSPGSQAPRSATPKAFPNLPAGLFSSPFTPQPNELRTSPDKPTMNESSVAPQGFSASQQQYSAAAYLNQMTGGVTEQASWNRNSRTAKNVAVQPVNQILQESLARQFQPMSMSSAFTDSSSIYGNTPYRGRGLRSGSFNPLPEANMSTVYAGASDVERMAAMFPSSYLPMQNGHYTTNPPAGQQGD